MQFVIKYKDSIPIWNKDVFNFTQSAKPPRLMPRQYILRRKILRRNIRVLSFAFLCLCEKQFLVAGKKICVLMLAYVVERDDKK
ncbi:hypothetical protein HYN59_02605 [Flavobacterium album]|uniref:Uncharacterized protein n=1 Tax=Flavobacterium album TaxID=2175091 RepID=A0A2S1QUH1_9FLAO|nr:hypothetical protein HYN59_02605 [Flavobacterium album]